MRRYEHTEMHRLLCDRHLSEMYRAMLDGRREVGAQALFCPYYVPLDGILGADWGVITNPESTRFGLLTFEHDDCGCPPSPTEDRYGWGRHDGEPSQDGDTWSTGWRHTCGDLCDEPCPWANPKET